MPIGMSEEELFDLGAELSPLRDEGVFILATGNLVHDLRHANFSPEELPPVPYAAAFDAWVATALRKRDDKALTEWLDEAPTRCTAIRAPSTTGPSLSPPGAAQKDSVVFPVEGFEHGTIARRCVQFD